MAYIVINTYVAYIVVYKVGNKEVKSMYQKFLTTAEVTADNQANLNIRTKAGQEYQVSMDMMERITRTRSGKKTTIKNDTGTANLWISGSGKALCFNDPTTGFCFVSLSSLLKVCTKGGKGYLVSPPEKEAPVKEKVVVTPGKYGFEAMDLPPRDNTHPTRKVEPC